MIIRTVATCVVAVTLLLTFQEASAWWQIKLSTYRCEATWRMGGDSYVRLYEDAETRRIRKERGLEPNKPMLEWWLHDSENVHSFSSVQDVPWEEHAENRADPTELHVEVRVFPDDGEERSGFFPIVTHTDAADFPYGRLINWYDFDMHDRLRRWGTAKETSDDAGVRLPEVRLILSFTKDVEVRVPNRGHDHLSRDTVNAPQSAQTMSDTVPVTHYIDVPLWRLNNVMNKLERCSANLVGY